MTRRGGGVVIRKQFMLLLLKHFALSRLRKATVVRAGHCVFDSHQDAFNGHISVPIRDHLLNINLSCPLINALKVDSCGKSHCGGHIRVLRATCHM